MDESLFPTYLNNGTIRSTAGAPVSSQSEVPAQPFALKFAPPPAVTIPPLATINTRTQAGQPTPRATPLGSPPSDNGLPKGVPANAIPVIRGMDLSYDIPGTGQRLYPTINGGVSQFNPEQQFELARYVEPERIRAGAEVQSAGIRSGGEVAAALGAARIGQEGAFKRQLLETTATPRPFGTEAYHDPNTNLTVPLPTYGVPQIDTNTGVVKGFTPIGAAAQRANPNVKVGDTYNAPDGKYGQYTVKNKKIVATE